MPLLTTLIPAYKKEYLAEVFQGLQRQNFRDFRIILSDDSPNDEISALIAAGHYGSLLDGLDLSVVRGPKHARLNMRALLQRWNGGSPLVHIHLDDDLIYPDFYQQHVQAHARGRFSASISQRWYTEDDNRPVCNNDPPASVAQSPLRVVPLDAELLFRTMVPTCDNWLGEFSHLVMTAASARLWPGAPEDGLNYYGWMDVGFVLTVVKVAPIAFIRDHLGVFRQHSGQSTHHVHHHGGRVSTIAWAAVALQAWAEGRVDYGQAVHAIKITVRTCLEKFGDADPVMNEFFGVVQREGGQLEGLYRAFSVFWRRLLASHPSTAASEPVLAERLAA